MQVKLLADQIVNSATNKGRHFVAIAGPPGSGKSTLSQALFEELSSRGEAVKVVPMDGFHLDNSVLIKKDLLARKGAPETFDVMGMIKLIERLADNEDDVVIPVFDRTRDVSVAGAELVLSADKFLIVEGNYLLLNETPWTIFRGFWDQTIFIKTEVKDLEERLVDRWMELGLSSEEAREKVRRNDLLNIELVLNHSVAADIMIS
jgi:pantothenate kinase